MLMLLLQFCHNPGIFAFPAADYHWKFDASSNGFTYASSSQSLNKGLLYPGTKIVPDSNRTGKVAYFNGTNSGIAIDNFQSNCFVYPSTCDKGLSIAFWIKWTKVKAQYLLCSANLTFQDYTGSVLPLSLWNGTHQWRIFSTPGNDATEWHCYAIVWDKHVLYLYIDGKKVHQDIGSHSASGPDGLLPSQMKPRRLTLGNTAKENVIIEDTVGMYMDDLRIRERNISSSDIEEICKDGIKKPIEPNQNQEVFGGLSNLSGFSSMKYTGRKLLGYLYQRHLTGGIVDCFQTCLEAQENCKSFNFGKDTTQIDYICELNNATAAEQPSALVHWNSYNYYDCV